MMSNQNIWIDNYPAIANWDATYLGITTFDNALFQEKN